MHRYSYCNINPLQSGMGRRNACVMIMILWVFSVWWSISTSLVSAGTSSFSSVSFPLTYIDAESSLVRSVAADPSDLPTTMPMRGFVAAGRAIRLRLEKQRESMLAKAPGRKPVISGKLSYNKDRVGDFYLTVPVGTPPQPLIFLVDTGSEFTWSQCSPCALCNATHAPRFAFNKSSSFLRVPCDSVLCGNSLGLSVTKPCGNTTGPLCIFTVGYGDGSVDAGIISVDSFALGPHYSKPMVFGCATVVIDTIINPSSGLLGLSTGPFSFTSQLFGASSHMQKKFAYCLPDRFESLNAPGELVFGNYKRPANLSYTPLVPPYSPLGNLYYYVDLKGITVGKAFIEVADVMKAQKGMVETRGTIFDSGSAFTTLVKPVYNELVKEMKRQTAHLRPFVSTGADQSADLCYKVPLQEEEPPSVPTVTLHFAGRVELVLGPGSVLYAAESDHKSISFCLAFQPGSDTDNQNVIGNYQQQNYWVEYNLQTSSLGLAKARCAK